jgi:transcriptional regulator of NAD metabolism
MYARVAEFKKTLENKNESSPDIELLVIMCDGILNHKVSLEGLDLKNIE